MPPKIFNALATMGKEAAAGRVRDFAERLDSWANDVTGLGTTRDKTTYGRFVARSFLEDQQKSDLYHFDDMAARMVDVVPDELYREGFSLLAIDDADLSGRLNAKFAELNVRQKFVEGKRWGRCFGGSAAIVGCDDGRDAKLPLRANRANNIDWLEIVDKRDLMPLAYYSDPKSLKYGMPEVYLVSVSNGSGPTTPRAVHESRLMFFGGAPTGDRERRENSGWDLSVLQRPYEVLRSFNVGWQSVENLLTDAHQAVYKMAGLADAIAANNGEYIKQRAALSDMARSVVRAMVIDAGDPSNQQPAEEFSRQSVSFSDIPGTLDKFMLRLAASVRIPVTILMGQSPAGMNATGDSDFRWFYDQLRAEQQHQETPRIQELAYLWLQTKEGGGYRPDQLPVVMVEWAPLWTETPAAEASRRKTVIDGDVACISSGIYTPNEVALSRARPGGFDQEIQLSTESIKARESALKIDLVEIASPAPEPVETEAGRFDADDQPRDESGRFGEGSGSSDVGSGDEDPQGDESDEDDESNYEAQEAEEERLAEIEERATDFAEVETELATASEEFRQASAEQTQAAKADIAALDQQIKEAKEAERLSDAEFEKAEKSNLPFVRHERLQARLAYDPENTALRQEANEAAVEMQTLAAELPPGSYERYVAARKLDDLEYDKQQAKLFVKQESAREGALGSFEKALADRDAKKAEREQRKLGRLLESSYGDALSAVLDIDVQGYIEKAKAVDADGDGRTGAAEEKDDK